MQIKAVFMGSPEFSLPSLRSLAQHYQVTGVVTQPDRQAGRGRSLTPPPVKGLATELGIEIYQPKTLRTQEAFEKLAAWQPDLIVVAAFGQILRENVLSLPKFGCLNVHASLLPRWRGAAPINAAILHGDAQTGITIMKMDAGLDTGAILAARSIPILPEDDAGSLSAKLAALGGNFLVEVLPEYLSGELLPLPQDDSLATYAPMLNKLDGELDFSEPAEMLARKVRAYRPWPGAFFRWKEEPLKVHRVSVVSEISGNPGKRIIYQSSPAVVTARGLLVLEEVQPAGKRTMPGKIFLNGARDWELPD